MSEPSPATSDALPSPRRDSLLTVLRVVAALLLVPAGLLVLLAAFVGLSGDGFTDAAPWWVVILMAALVLAVPGAVVLLLARARRLHLADAVRRARRDA